MPHTNSGKSDPSQLKLDFWKRSSAPPPSRAPETMDKKKTRIVFDYTVALNPRKRFREILGDKIYSREKEPPFVRDDRGLYDEEIYTGESEAEEIRGKIAEIMGSEYTAEIKRDAIRGDLVLKIYKKLRDSEFPPPKGRLKQEKPEKGTKDEKRDPWEDLGYKRGK